MIVILRRVLFGAPAADFCTEMTNVAGIFAVDRHRLSGQRTDRRTLETALRARVIVALAEHSDRIGEALGRALLACLFWSIWVLCG